MTRIADALERIAAAMEKGNRETELHWKRSEAGKKGAAVVRRAEGGKFAPAAKDDTRSGIALAPANTGKTPANAATQQTLPALPSTNPIQFLIGVYVEAWQRKYKTRARPELRQAMGVFKALLRERGAEELAELVQVYCQMEDRWFSEKRHDIASFGANVGKIAIAHDKGHDTPTGERHWTEIVKEHEGGKQ